LEQLTRSKDFQFPGSFSPDGKRLAFSSYDAAGIVQVWTVALEDDGGHLRASKPEPFRHTQFDEYDPSFSTDGRWLAYVSTESGREEVDVEAFPAPISGQSGKWQISNNGGQHPVWSRNGRDLLYLGGDQVMAVRYTVKAILS
jgi:serine/threonine-protein kinase